MSTTTKAIVLGSLKYGDTSLVVRLYTESHGRITCMVKGVLGRRKSGLRASLFVPLTQLDIVAGPVREGRMGYLKEASVSAPYSGISQDIRKGAIALFLSEVLSEAIREQESNPELFRYLETALQFLDSQRQVANFHLRFLIGLSRFLGFYPDEEGSDLPYFDLNEGAFRPAPSLNPMLTGSTLQDFRRVLGTKFDAIHEITLSQKSRQNLLKALLLYYEIHLQGFRTPKSLTVFDAVFS